MGALVLKSAFIKKTIILACLALMFGGGFYTFTFFHLKNGKAWEFAEREIKSSSEVQSKYGKIKKTSMSFFGVGYSLRGGIERASIKSTVEGELSSGVIHLHLRKYEGGDWTLEALQTP